MTKIFRIEYGFCHLTPEKIIFTTGKAIESSDKPSRGVWNFFWTAVLIAVVGFILTKTILMLENRNYFEAFIAGAGLIYIGIKFFRTNQKEILRERIQKIDIKKGVHGYTSSSIRIFFLDNKGRRRKQLVKLSGSVFDKDKYVIEALEILKDEKLMDDLKLD